jgi:hypothetical protein
MDPLKRVRVAAPCPASWERMAGDERIRHCTLCDLNVYNFAELTGDEIRDLLARTEGRLCARLYRRADGTLLTKDCPTGLRALRRRVSRRAAAVFAALVGASAFLTGCATSPKKKHSPRVQVSVEPAPTPQPAVFTGQVCDFTGQPLPGVSVVLHDEAGQGELVAVTDEQGVFSIASPTDGTYHVELELSEFTPAVIEHLVLKQNAVTRARVSMGFDSTSLTGVVVTASTPVGQQPLSTTYSQEFIDKLPH